MVFILDVFKEDHLFLASDVFGGEPFGVSKTDGGEDAEVRFDDMFKMLHFLRFTDASLNNGDVVFSLNIQDAEGDACLRVVAARAAVDSKALREDRAEEFLGDCFTKRSCDADDFCVVLLTPERGDVLQ